MSQLKVKKSEEQEIYELRYIAYLDNNSIDVNKAEVYVDEFDETANCVSFLRYIDRHPAGCIRACIYNPKNRNLHIPAMENYGHEINSYFSKDTVILEANKYAIHPTYQNRHRSLKFGLYADVLELANNIGAEYLLGAIKPQNERFYTQAGFVPIAPTKLSLRNKFYTTLMACPIDKANKYRDAHPRHFNLS